MYWITLKVGRVVLAPPYPIFKLKDSRSNSLVLSKEVARSNVMVPSIRLARSQMMILS